MKAAAVIGASVLAGLAFTACSSSSHPPGGSASPSAHSSVPPSSPGAPTPSRTTPTVGPTPTAGPALSGTVHLAGAVIHLPTGWVAREYPTNVGRIWCFAPRTQAPPRTTDQCSLTLRRLPDPPGRNVFAVNEIGTILRWPALGDCGASGRKGLELFRYGYRDFGGRRADYRRWQFACGNGTTFAFAQYVVATKPAYVLFAQHATPTLRAVQSALAAGATLPAQRAPLRYQIMGDIEARSHQRDGWHVTLRPWVRRPNLPASQFVAVPGGIAQTYVIPDRLVIDGGMSLLGSIALETDGRRVTSLTIIGG